ncbi:MAG: LPD23 domain-containing protein, partial [Campylobacter hyointestinalis]
KELLSQGQVPVGWKKGATNIGFSTEQPKWANKFKTKMEKMGQEYNDEKIANLAKWHKDSHAVTKESDGSPKVFYHGSEAKEFKYFDTDNSGNGYYFTTLKKEAELYKNGEFGNKDGGTLYNTFLNIKKLFEMDKIKINNLKDLQYFAKAVGSKQELGEKELKKYNAMKAWVDEARTRAEAYGFKINEIGSNQAVLVNGKKAIRVDIFNNSPYDKETGLAYHIFKDFEPFDIYEHGIDFGAYGFVRNDADIATFLLNDINREYSDTLGKSLKDKLKAKGYDGIKFNDYQYSVFSPNQIKSISNKGTFNPRSKMMNGFSTMAMQKAILNLGSGTIGGVMNANAEQDPSKKHEAFVKGFLLGAGGSAGAIKMLEKSADKLAPQLARISQRLANDLPVILNDRPDIIGKALGKTPKDNYNYIFGGENAIGANKAKLKTAGEMSKNGADESEIWAKTGWYKDIDKKWKFEINPLGGKFKKAIKDLFDAKAFKQNNREKLELLQDKAKINDKYQTNLNNLNATLSQKANIIVKAKDGLKLSEVLDDKKLFNAYPQLRDVKVRFDELDGEIYDGYYNRTLDEIVLNSNLYNKPEMLRSILYHEMQHKVQSIEGFASGGMDKDVLDYRRLAGEVEARNEQTRLIPSKLNNARLERTTDLENLEKIVKALPKSQANEQISKELIALKKQDMALDKEYGKISPQRDKEIDRLTDELDNRFSALVGQIDKDELATALLKVYNKTKHPNATADVIPELRKVVFNDSGMSASANPRQKASQYAKWLSQASKMPPQAPDELYKAYDKAKKDLNRPKNK